MNRALVAMLCFCGLAPASETDLCGAADTKVCLQNGLNIQININPVILPGSAFLVTLPGVSVDGNLTPSGSPEVPYRLSLKGLAFDDQGGTWSEPRILYQDFKGAGAIAFILDEGSLTDVFQLSLQNIEVCQKISDGPGPVILGIQFWINTGNKTWAPQAQFKMSTGLFGHCADYAGNLPIVAEEDQLYVTNPNDESVLITVDGASFVLKAHEQRRLEDRFTRAAVAYAGSLPARLVLYSDLKDINLVAIEATNHKFWLLPHIARDQVSWQNHWHFANERTLNLNWQHGNHIGSQTFGAGVHKWEPQTGPDAAAWMRIQANEPFNGYFEFSRHAETGSAWVNGFRLPEIITPGTQRLYLPHVASDTASFWTGYSLANPNPSPANITLKSRDESGAINAVEEFTIEPGASDVGLIGIDHLAGRGEIAWIEIESDQPIAGLELVGIHNAAAKPIAGLLLPSRGGDRLVFPLLKTQASFWSAIAITNISDEPTALALEYFDAQGTKLESLAMDLGAGQRGRYIAPPGAAQAICRGTNLIGFCLIGQGNEKIGAYLGN